jgi:hypothetical protein
MNGISHICWTRADIPENYAEQRTDILGYQQYQLDVALQSVKGIRGLECDAISSI